MHSNSLAKRIFLASIVLLPLVLAFSAYMLERAFKTSLITAEKESLLAHTYSMMAVAEPEDDFIVLPEKLTDSRFNDPASGLYAQVLDEEYGPVWRSISLNISQLKGKIPSRKVEMGEQYIEEQTIDNQAFFISRFDTVWEIDDEDLEYQFVVIHSQDEMQREIQTYRKTLAAWLGGLAVLIIAMQTAIIRWGLQPLHRLAQDIKKLEDGAIRNLDDQYPEEILPVTTNINRLIKSEDRQRKRYKNTLADLAHSLKTPLTVIRSLLQKDHINDGDVSKNIDEQIDRMSTIINHQLNRANTNSATFLSNLKLAPLVDRLASALDKVYREKNIHFVNNLSEKMSYPAQEDDVMEFLGNILENAFKYAKHQVKISGEIHHNYLQLHIEDDGAGVPEFMQKEILKRGTRADTSIPGQGIGLAVAADIVASYGGELEAKSATISGAKFTISLPLHRKSIQEI